MHDVNGNGSSGNNGNSATKHHNGSNGNGNSTTLAEEHNAEQYLLVNTAEGKAPPTCAQEASIKLGSECSSSTRPNYRYPCIFMCNALTSTVLYVLCLPLSHSDRSSFQPYNAQHRDRKRPAIHAPANNPDGSPHHHNRLHGHQGSVSRDESEQISVSALIAMQQSKALQSARGSGSSSGGNVGRSKLLRDCASDVHAAVGAAATAAIGSNNVSQAASAAGLLMGNCSNPGSTLASMYNASEDTMLRRAGMVSSLASGNPGAHAPGRGGGGENGTNRSMDNLSLIHI